VNESIQTLLLDVATMKAEKGTQQSSVRAPPAPSNAVLHPAKIHEIEGDLFADAPADASLAHCVGGDFSMGAGIAPRFKTIYGQVAYLKGLNLRPGQVACLPVPDENGHVKYVMYLVTKPRSARCLPKFEDFSAAVREMASLCRSLGITTLALPRIGAGLDRLWWPQVLQVLHEAFRGVNTDVLVFNQPAERTKREQMSRLYSDVAAATPPAASRLQPPPQRPAPLGRQAPRRQQRKSAVQRTSPSDRLMNDLRKRDDRGGQSRTEFNARARKGDRYVPKHFGASQSNTNPLCSVKPSEAPLKPDAAAPPVPGRGSALKAAAATVSSAKGGPAERSTEACKLTGASSLSALSSTPPPPKQGEPSHVSIPPLAELPARVPNAAPDAPAIFSPEETRRDVDGDADTEKRRNDDDARVSGGGSIPPELPPLSSEPPRTPSIDEVVSRLVVSQDEVSNHILSEESIAPGTLSLLEGLEDDVLLLVPTSPRVANSPRSIVSTCSSYLLSPSRQTQSQRRSARLNSKNINVTSTATGK